MNPTLLNAMQLNRRVSLQNAPSADLALNDVKNRKFIVGSINSQGDFSISTKPVRHDSLDSAERECDRLSRLSPGTAYIAMQLSGGRLQPKIVDTFKL